MSLFLTVGAMAQTELDGCYVAFTNVQQNGTEYSLYVNANNELAVSTTPVSELGESAKFKCELKDNGKYTFYNENAGVYMIWRGKGSGYNSDKGVLAEYNATYCDWTLVLSANKPGCYFFYSKRNGGSSDGSLVIMNANGAFDAYGNSEGWAGNYSNVYKITNLSVGATVEITYEFTYNGVVRDELTYSTDAEIGKEFPTIFTTFPFGLSATKPEGTVEESHGGQTFTIELEENLPFVAAESYESITHWYYMAIKPGEVDYLYHETDQANIPLNQATKPAAEAKYAWAFVGNPFDGYAIYNYAAGADMVLSSSTTMSGSNGGGTYPVMTAIPVPNGNNALWVPTASTHGTNGFYLAQKGNANNRMNNRDHKLAYWTGGADAGSTFQVERCIVPGGYYRIAYDNSGTVYYLQGVASSVKGCAFTQETDAASVWYYGDSKLLSYTAGKYIKEDGNTRGLQGVGVEGGNVTVAASPRGNGKYTIACTSYLHFNTSGSNYFGDHCGSEGGHSNHDMILENVMSLPVTISEAGFATLYAPVALKVADGVVAYTVTINGEWATLNEITSGVIPAETGVIIAGVNGEAATAKTYNFAITTSEETLESDLRGSAPATYYTTAGTYYALGVVDGVTAFYKDKFNNSRFQNNSHKAYLYVANASNTASYSFRFGEGTTAIENVEVENEVKAIYDLTGRKIVTITKAGIYIVGGKKVLVK